MSPDTHLLQNQMNFTCTVTNSFILWAILRITHAVSH